MCEVTIPRDASAHENLPKLCVACGRRAAWFRRISVPGESSGVGIVVTPTAYAAVDQLERFARGGWVWLPVCGWHRWIVPPQVTASAHGDRVRLHGVSPAFAAALPGR